MKLIELRNHFEGKNVLGLDQFAQLFIVLKVNPPEDIRS